MRAVIAMLLALALTAQDRNADLRERMVRSQMESRGITDERVLDAMRSVPRHLFMPENVRHLAHEDAPAPIGYGQTISQPYIVALMTQLLDAGPNDTVLEIGTGSGYQAAVLARLAKHVYTIELIPELAARARETLEKLGYGNVTVRVGDGYKGWPERAPFDRVMLTAAPAEIPPALVDQLKPAGRLVAPVGRSPYDQVLVVLEKDSQGQVKRRSVAPVRFVPMVKGR